VEVTLENLKYFYLPVLQNNKFNMLISVIEGIPSDAKIAIIAKTKQQIIDLEKFLKAQGFLCLCFNEQSNIEEEYKKEKESILLITLENIANAIKKNISITHIISTIASISEQECKEKASLCKENIETATLIELVTKFDHNFIKTLKDKPEINVQRFVLPSLNESKINRQSRLKSYINSCNNENFENTLSDDINNLISNLSDKEAKQILKNVLSQNINFVIPCIESNMDKLSQKEIQLHITIDGGSSIGIEEEPFKEYLLKGIENKKENIVSIQISENKTTIILINVQKYNLMQYLAQNQFNEAFLKIESANENEIFSSNKPNFSKNRSNDGYQRREYSNDRPRRFGGGDRNRNGGGGGYRDRNRDNDRNGDQRKSGFEDRPPRRYGNDRNNSSRNPYSSNNSSYEKPRYNSDKPSFERSFEKTGFEKNSYGSSDKKGGSYNRYGNSGGYGGGKKHYGDKNSNSRSSFYKKNDSFYKKNNDEDDDSNGKYGKDSSKSFYKDFSYGNQSFDI
jgi:hypothetical protein